MNDYYSNYPYNVEQAYPVYPNVQPINAQPEEEKFDEMVQLQQQFAAQKVTHPYP